MKATSNAIRINYNEHGKQELTLTLVHKQDISDLKEVLEKGKELTVEIKPYRKSRSLDANGYLWAMCNQIAVVLKCNKDDVYLMMLERYGVFTHLVVKPNVVARVMAEWRTVRELGEVTVNGQTGVQLQCYFGSSTYDSKEFSVLLDGVIGEANELGIDTLTASEKNLMLEGWGK